VIASDHAPHHYDAKEREFYHAPNGIIGLETALGVAVRDLVETGVLTLPALIDRMSTRAARIFNLPGGTLAVGAPADVVVFDPKERWIVQPERFCSKSRNTPYGGAELIGRTHQTVVRGRIAFDIRDR
jgi:dihydroorotase